MKNENIYNDWSDNIPTHWVLTVRRCSCGSTLWWDKKDETWHCMKESCAEYKSHLRNSLTKDMIYKIMDLGEVESPKRIAKELNVPYRKVKEILERI